MRAATAAATAGCGSCRHFSGAAREVEARLPGLRSLGSMDGAVRAADGLCGLHRRYLAASSHCASYAAGGRVAPPR